MNVKSWFGQLADAFGGAKLTLGGGGGINVEISLKDVFDKPGQLGGLGVNQVIAAYSALLEVYERNKVSCMRLVSIGLLLLYKCTLFMKCCDPDDGE